MAAPKQASQSWVELSSEDDVSASTCLPSGDSDSPNQKAAKEKAQWADIEDSDHEGEHHHSEEKNQQRWSDVPCDSETLNGAEVKQGNDGWAVVGKKPKQALKQVQDCKDVSGKPAEQPRRSGRDFAETAPRSGSKGQQGASQASQDGKQWGSTKANGLASPEVSKQWKANNNPKQDSSWGGKAQSSSKDSGKQWGKERQAASLDGGKVWGKQANGVSDAGKWGAKDAKLSAPSDSQSPSHQSGNDGWGRGSQDRWSRSDTTPTSRAPAEAWNSKPRKDNSWGSSPRAAGAGAGSERSGRSNGQTRMDSARLNW
mmetsp:Transcript_22793/g.52091  ORF Transcript_22793/g.52091 Transcript_22793/m.52091 type:complete len:314 (-) Transcript_22793:265-1206(-)